MSKFSVYILITLFEIKTRLRARHTTFRFNVYINSVLQIM